MPANERPASKDGFTITRTEEYILRERISYLTRQANTLNQLLDDYRRQGVSSSHRSQTETAPAHHISASASCLTVSGDSERHFQLKLV
jgi:hypothetical protein